MACSCDDAGPAGGSCDNAARRGLDPGDAGAGPGGQVSAAVPGHVVERTGRCRWRDGDAAARQVEHDAAVSTNGFTVLYWLRELAKLAIVGALTINGVVVHRLVLPSVAQACPFPLVDGFRHRRRLLLILSGALSILSWYSALTLELLHEVNGRVPADTLLGLWLTPVLLSMAALDGVLSFRAATPARRAQGGGGPEDASAREPEWLHCRIFRSQ